MGLRIPVHPHAATLGVRIRRLVLLPVTALVIFLPQTSREQTASHQRSMLGAYDLSARPKARFKLPARLSEISGLTMTDDGRLFAHDDERGVVYQLDYTTGRIVKQFSLGRWGVRADFEGIAVKGKVFYLVESNGTLYEFPEGKNDERVSFRTYRTFLTSKNDVEGLCYDPTTDALLLLCKADPGKGYQKHKAVYEFSLKTKSLSSQPRLLIPLKDVTRSSDGHLFNPSGIERHPRSGTFFVIAAQGHAIVELASDGTVLAQQRINKKSDPHPEGITFAPDGSLLLCNDGQGGSGSLSVYASRW